MAVQPAITLNDLRRITVLFPHSSLSIAIEDGKLEDPTDLTEEFCTIVGALLDLEKTTDLTDFAAKINAHADLVYYLCSRDFEALACGNLNYAIRQAILSHNTALLQWFLRVFERQLSDGQRRKIEDSGAIPVPTTCHKYGIPLIIGPAPMTIAGAEAFVRQFQEWGGIESEKVWPYIHSIRMTCGSIGKLADMQIAQVFLVAGYVERKHFKFGNGLLMLDLQISRLIKDCDVFHMLDHLPAGTVITAHAFAFLDENCPPQFLGYKQCARTHYCRWIYGPEANGGPRVTLYDIICHRGAVYQKDMNMGENLLVYPNDDGPGRDFYAENSTRLSNATLLETCYAIETSVENAPLFVWRRVIQFIRYIKSRANASPPREEQTSLRTVALRLHWLFRLIIIQSPFAHVFRTELN